MNRDNYFRKASSDIKEKNEITVLLIITVDSCQIPDITYMYMQHTITKSNNFCSYTGKAHNTLPCTVTQYYCLHARTAIEYRFDILKSIKV